MLISYYCDKKCFDLIKDVIPSQDAHEFLSQCLDQLKEDMEKLNKTWKTEPVPGEENSPDISATRVYTCPVITNLEFEVQHSIICKA